MPRLSAHDARLFELRLERSRRDLFDMFDELYGQRPDYAGWCARLEEVMRAAWRKRPNDLKWLDMARDLEPDWFQRPDMVGYVAYVDRFAGDFSGVTERLDYLESLGVTYVHFMPCLMPRRGESDGGYSVKDYRRTDPRLGTMAEFRKTAAALRARGMSVCFDLVLNHTAREHAWAVAARKGDAEKREYYHIYPDRSMPDIWERSLLEVFPETAPGNFTWEKGAGWVWTTFNTHQWDLNWANPAVFVEIADTMLFLANQGVDVLRLDAVAFMWKRQGTRCQSEPEVHMILQALRAVCRIACPAVIHLEEAIVGPAEMLPYLGRGRHDGKEGNLAYHNSLMVQFWSALASRDTRLMRHVLATHFPATLTNATYATYCRCHDDIGWAVTEEDAEAVGLSGPAHRQFLSEFYEGRFPGSFAKGALFGVNPETGDSRISGSFASLAGLERAIVGKDATAARMAVQRILMGHALIAGWGGIPLIYMGDEIAMLNDDSYLDDPDKRHDSRWIHRPRMDWATVARIDAGKVGPSAEVLHGVRHIMARRKATPELHGSVPIVILDPQDARVFVQRHAAPTGALHCIYNFSEDWCALSAEWLSAQGVQAMHDALADAAVRVEDGDVSLPPYAGLWLR